VNNNPAAASMLFAIILFCVLLVWGRNELGLTWIAVSLLIFLGALGICIWLNIAPGYFMAFAAVVDIALVLKIFGGDVYIG
jgi:hypothetical protein